MAENSFEGLWPAMSVTEESGEADMIESRVRLMRRRPRWSVIVRWPHVRMGGTVGGDERLGIVR